MARYSLNQIEHTVRKAARGAGLSWGVAEDAGRAARWLQMVGVPGASLFAAALLELDHSDADANRIRQRRLAPDSGDGPIDTLGPVAGVLSPVVVGPCIGDWVNAIEVMSGIQETAIAIEDVAHPLILAGYCGVAAQQTQLALLVHWQGFQMWCTINEARLLGEKERSSIENRVVIQSVNTERMSHCENTSIRNAHIGSAEVDQTTWNDLEAFTHKTYVEASESSRLSGAGAGLNDND